MAPDDNLGEHAMFYVYQMNDGRWQVDAYTSAPRSARMMAARAPGFDTKEAAENARRQLVSDWSCHAIADAHLAFAAADDDWQRELVTAYGADACNARYDARGRGAFYGPLEFLGRAFLAREKARMAWESARFQSELTPAGEQLVIPGCERVPPKTGKPAQLSLWG